MRDSDLLTDLSPLDALDRLRAPLLLVHGSDDTNVPVGESKQVAEVLRSRGVPHRLLVFEGEGHELLLTDNRVAFVQATLGWVLEHLWKRRSRCHRDKPGSHHSAPQGRLVARVESVTY